MRKNTAEGCRKYADIRVVAREARNREGFDIYLLYPDGREEYLTHRSSNPCWYMLDRPRTLRSFLKHTEYGGRWARARTNRKAIDSFDYLVRDIVKRLAEEADEYDDPEIFEEVISSERAKRIADWFSTDHFLAV